MNRQIASLVLALTAAAAPLPAWATALRLKRIMLVEHNTNAFSADNYHPLCDIDRDGRLEMVYRTGGVYPPGNYQRWEIGRFEPHRRWRVLFSDTCPFPPPNGIHRSYFVPGDIGDTDGDGLLEIIGFNWEFRDSTNPGLLMWIEQSAATALPDVPVWTCSVSTYGQVYGTIECTGSLDPDSLWDVPYGTEWTNEYHVMFETRGDNRHLPVWTAPQWMTTFDFAFGDFDGDGLTEVVGGIDRVGDRVMVWKSAGDDEYVRSWQDPIGLYNSGQDCFTSGDADGDARPEFYMGFYRYIGGYPPAWMCHLYRWESDEAGGYTRYFVDSVATTASDPVGRSRCGDLDGDGLDEVVFSVNQLVVTYRADSAGDLERAGWIWNELSPDLYNLNVNIADVDYNGYNDVLLGSQGRLGVYSVEAIRLTTPNTGTFSPGDTVRVGWQLYRPPRCDSVSLFLRRDSTWRLDTIARGLPPVDSSFVWTVPNVRVDSGWLMAMAYGPGWQYDETDNPIRITGSGAVEERPVEVYHTGLRAEPNPCAGRCRVGYEVARRGPVRLTLVDAAGREAATLASGPHEPGRHWATLGSARERLPAGVYFLRLEADGTRLVRKVVVR